MTNELPVIYIARHGETAWTITGQHTGLTDLPLTAQGEKNAQRGIIRQLAATLLEATSTTLNIPQADIVKELVDARDKLWMSGVMRANHNANNPENAQLEKQTRELDERIVAQQRAQAKPYPYRFDIQKISR